MGIVRHLDEQRLGISLRIDGDRPHSQPLRGLDDPAGDFAAIGDEDGFEHEAFLFC
jgi:hypothetical protein